MRLIHHDQKQGILKVELTDPEDILVLKRAIGPTDLIRGQTERKLKVGGGEEQKSVRKRVFIEIRVEKSEIESATLRILGTITQGPEDVGKGEHHSFSLTQGDIIEIQKRRWPTHILERIHESCSAKRKILVVAFERDQASIGLLTTHGLNVLHELRWEPGKKQYAQPESNGFKQLADVIKTEYERTKADQAILGSPQFWQQYLLDAISPEIRNRTVTATCSSGDINGLHEVLKRPELKVALERERAVRETYSMDILMKAIGQDKAFYGMKETEEMIRQSNVKTLLMSEKLLSEESTAEHSEKILENAEQTGASITIITSHEQTKLDSLGGVAGIKRW